MLTAVQRKRLRKEHIELANKIKTQEKIQEEIKALGDTIRIQLLNGEPISFAIRVCDTCGFRAYNDKDLEHFYKGSSCHHEVKICKCCGKPSKRFTSENHYVCTDCIGQSIDNTIVPEWANSPIRFTLKLADGAIKEFDSVSSAAKVLGLPQSSLQNLVIGYWSSYKGMTSEVIPQVRTYDELNALRASKRLTIIKRNNNG